MIHFIITTPTKKESPFLYLQRPDDKEATFAPLPGGSGRPYEPGGSITFLDCQRNVFNTGTAFPNRRPEF
jgi:hypothetical protein